MVELHVANVVVASSNLVSRSILYLSCVATSPSGKAKVCKIFIPGSNPGVASSFFYEICTLSGYSYFAGVVELVDTRDLKSLGTLFCAGSSPASGTIKTSLKRLVFYF